jgi:hypothetical protein
VVVAGDFNLIRGSADKSNANIDWSRVRLFNDSIARMDLGEIKRTGARFTWSNKQANPVRSVLDRVLVSASWEGKFLLLSLCAETRIGSDHTPLILDSGVDIPPPPPRVSRFVFENGWLLVQGFKDILSVKWRQLLEEPRCRRDPVEVWHGSSAALCSFLKGWSANLGSNRKRENTLILSQIRVLDDRADSVSLSDDDWALRYHLEECIIQIYQREEEYWRQRGRLKWTLQGDANTKYFHAVANGRRRKCTISTLSSGSGFVSDKLEIQKLIYDFYRELMGSEDPFPISLVKGIWTQDQCASQEDNDSLIRSFLPEELDQVLKETKTDTALGPDGFPVIFFKSFWSLVKPFILQLLNGFALGLIDISRLNFGILSLIPKVPGADDIK